MRRAILTFGLALVAFSPRATAYQPSSLASLVLWADGRQTPYSDAGTTLAVDGSGINYISDLSGAGNHLRQTSTGNQLSWTAADGAFESQWALSYMTAASLNVNRRSFSAFIVTKDLESLTSTLLTTPHVIVASGDGAFVFGYASDTSSGPSTARVLSVWDGSAWQSDTVQIPSSPSLLGIACGASACKFIVNDHVTTIAALASGTTTGGTTWFGISGPSSFPGPGGPFTEPLRGGVVLALAQSSQSTPTEITDLQAFAKARGAIDPADVRNVIVWMGDSITDVSLQAVLGQTYIRTGRSLRPRAVEYNVGRTSTVLTDGLTTYLPIAANYITAGKLNTLVIFWGTNDIKNGVSGATTYTNLLALVAAARVDGFDKIVVCTMLPRTGVTTERTTYNTSIRSDGGVHFDAVADWAATASMGDDGDQLDLTYYMNDGIHPNNAGHRIGGPIVAAAVKTVLLDYGLVR